MNAGIANALKMREMFNLDKYTRARFNCDENGIKVIVHPWNGEYLERPIATYKFREDGTYTKSSHQ